MHTSTECMHVEASSLAISGIGVVQPRAHASILANMMHYNDDFESNLFANTGNYANTHG